MTSFIKMLNSRQVYFSLLRKSNDGGECRSDRHYMMCFNFGEEENIALWDIYGIPRNDSICLKFPCQDIKEWLASARDGDLAFYGVEDNRRTALLNEACPKISICDVAYYDNGIFTHKGNLYRVHDGQICIDPYHDSRLNPYVKRWAWSFESEVRIVLEFDKPVLNSKGKPYKRIAVDFDEPLQALRDGEGEIRLGPWCRASAKTVQKRGLAKANVVSSEFTDVIKFRTHCSGCSAEKRKSCKCKYKNKM